MVRTVPLADWSHLQTEVKWLAVTGGQVDLSLCLYDTKKALKDLLLYIFIDIIKNNTEL